MGALTAVGDSRAAAAAGEASGRGGDGGGGERVEASVRRQQRCRGWRRRLGTPSQGC